jgi:hypothetical protein
VQVRADGRDRAGLDPRALAAIGLCAVLPVLIGILLTMGPVGSGTPVGQPAPGHWVYVPSRGVAVHVDGAAKRVDATVNVGSAGIGSPVLHDKHAAYLVGDDGLILFGPNGVTGDAPAAGVAERPEPVAAAGTAYLVYRTAGLITRLGPVPVTIPAGGPVCIPVVSPDGTLWTYRVDSGELCQLTGQATLSCPDRVPNGHTGALAVLDGRPGFVDVTAGTWRLLGDRATGAPVALGVALAPDAAVGAAAVAGRLPIVDRAGRRLLLVAIGGGVVTVPLGAGRFGRPVSTGGAVAVVNEDTGVITSYDPDGQRRAELAVPGGAVRLTTGDDGRVYADPADGLQSVVMDGDGTLTAVSTTGDRAPSYRPPQPTPSASLPPATFALTTTETIPPVPETVTVQVAPTTGQPVATTGPGRPNAAADTGTRTSTRPAPRPPDTTKPAPGAGTGSPIVDVLSAAATGPGQATIQIRVSGADPVFCHVYFNSVERAATRCTGTMTVVANGLAPNTTYDIYVLGTNAKGTGIPGRRGLLRT